MLQILPNYQQSLLVFPMSLQYCQSLMLKGPHEGPLPCLKFNPAVNLLTTADINGWLCVWKLRLISAYPQYITKGGTGFFAWIGLTIIPLWPE